MKQVFVIVLLVGTVVLVEGCVVAAVGAGAAGTVAYVRGDLEAVESKKLDEVYEATLKAVDELELNVTKKMKDAMSAVIVTRDAQDKKITIKLSATTEETTKLSVRIGLFGSETKSRLIYQKIHENLQ
jgi:glutamate synthase domain-containing protein 3